MKGPLDWTLATVAAATHGVVDGEPTMPVHSVSTDSRAVEPGAVFVALRGVNHDGHDHVALHCLTIYGFLHQQGTNAQ